MCLVMMVGLSLYSEVGTSCQATLHAVEGSLLDEMVITSSPMPSAQMLCEKDSLEENVCVRATLLNYTRLCHHDVPVIKGCATPGPQLLTASLENSILFVPQRCSCSVALIGLYRKPNISH